MNITLRSGTRLVRPDLQHHTGKNMHIPWNNSSISLEIILGLPLNNSGIHLEIILPNPLKLF